MSNDSPEVLIQNIKKYEEEVIDHLPISALPELTNLFIAVQSMIFEDPTYIEDVINSNREFGPIGIFSTFRVLKAIIAEIEYRINENLM